MNIVNNLVILSPAERALFGLCSLSGLEGKSANEVLATIDERLDGWESESVIDVVNMRIIEKVRNNLAVMSKAPERELTVLKQYVHPHARSAKPKSSLN